MAVSRAPLAKLQTYRQRLGWTFPWASSHGGEFNYDFNVSITETEQRAGGIEYNYRNGGHPIAEGAPPPLVTGFAASCGPDPLTYTRDRPGMSSLVTKDGVENGKESCRERGGQEGEV